MFAALKNTRKPAIMKPLGEDLLKLKNWDAELIGDSKDRRILGFLVDSPLGDLKRSGLISRSESVSELDAILTANNARLFYADPRKFSQDAYKKAVQSFDQFLNEADFINFEISPPYLLLVQKKEDRFTDLCLLEYDRRLSCMWYLLTRECLQTYVNEKKELQQDPKLQGFIKRCAGTVRDESLKELSLKLVGLLTSTAGAIFQ